MLLRPDGDAVICIGQPAHAFVSGQLAARWEPKPSEEVILAATQHDAGMADWDAAPELNRETGLPQSFMEMELDTHLRLWSHAPYRVLPQSRYAAVLVSMHGTALYEMRKRRTSAIERYLEEQRALQQELGAGFDQQQLRQDQQLLWTWDSMSLGLCLRWDGANEPDPWPFADDEITVHCDGRRLEGRFGDEQEMRAALAEAPWQTLSFELTRRLSR